MLGKRRWLWLWLFLLTCNVATAQNEQLTEGEKNEQSFRALEENITVDFFEHRFEDVLKDLGTQTGLTFIIDESSGDNNLDEEALITFSAGNMRAATVLGFMMRPFQCSWSIHDGVVVIMSEDAALDQLNLKVFDCTDLLARIEPRTELRGGGGFGGRGGGGRGGGGFGGGGGVFALQEVDDDPFGSGEETVADPFANDEEQETPAEDPNAAQQAEQQQQPPAAPGPFEVTISPHQQLVRLIQETVNPQSWEENGGTGKIVTINDLVVVRQTQINLREIATLLDLLERSGL